jgi:N-acetylmuramoyl-L-alanine amidase
MKNILKILFLILFLGYFFVFNASILLAKTKSSNLSKNPSQEYIYHTVRRGETLEGIARRYGVSVSEIRKWNKLGRGKVKVGQRLIVGVKEVKEEEKVKKEAIKKEEAKEEAIYHIVKRGETLDKIAKKYGISVKELKELNNLKSNKVYVGQRLIIKKEEKIEAKKTKAEKISEKEYIYHTVRRGETLEGIARRYGVSVSEIRKWNKLGRGKVKVGQRLIVGVKEVKEEEKVKKEAIAVSDIEKAFSELERKYESFLSNSQTTRTDWLKLLSEYRRLYLLYPSSYVAPKAILKTANIYFHLYKNFSDSESLNKAIERYNFLIRNHPRSSEAEEAYYRLIQIYREEIKDKEKEKSLTEEFKAKYPKSVYISKLEEKVEAKEKESKNIEKKLKTKKPQKELVKEIAKEPPKEIPKETAKEKIALSTVTPKKVLEVHPVTGEDYSRVIINVSDNFEYQANILKGDKERPPRIYVDIYPAILDSKVSKEIEIKDALLTGIRVAQFDEKTVRIVLDLNSLTSYKIFKLREPYQLVLDLIGKEKIQKSYAKEVPKKGEPKKEEYINLARQFGLGIKRIVIDPGHGGEDPGAVGPSGLKEKEVTLTLAKMLAQKLRNQLGIEVILTREEDKFIPLIQRPAIANSKKADLFISIHTNASPDSKGCGIETYYLNFTTDPEAMRVAALENAASDKSLSDLQDLIKAILVNTKLSESRMLAEKVQKELVKTLSRYYPDTMDRGVKYAPFLVLVGTRMPAILVEVGFISNPVEEKRLKDQQYLEMVVEGIAKGIEIYMQSLKFSQTYYEKKS